MKPTDEQIAIRNSTANTLLVSAGAGAAKTTTLVLFAEAHPSTPMTYLAFNRAVREEAQRKFPKNVRCVTTHGLAYSTHGKQYQAKLGNPKAYQIAQALGLQQQEAGAVLNIVTNFLTSKEREIGLPHLAGVSVPSYQRDQYIAHAKRAWAMMCDVHNNVVVIPHDGYLKLYQLSNPTIRTDVILFDEAQDSNPVTLAIVEAQKCRKVFVGDSRQSIYGFRGAVNAMDMIKADQHLHLTQSFRYGAGVARLANAVLGAYDPHPHPIRGAGKHETRFAFDQTKPHTVLSRTNGLLFGEAVSALRQGVPFAFVGGVDNYKFEIVLDTYYLHANRKDLIKDKMISSFATYQDMVAYGKALDDKEVNSLIRIVEEYGDEIPNLVERIRNEAVAVPTGNEILMTTAHKSKGLEWMDVRLTDDFTDMKAEKDNEGRLIPPDREEVNLLYVAMTRALRGIAVHSSIMEWMEAADRKLYWDIRTHQREMKKDGDPAMHEGVIVTHAENKGLLTSFGAVLGDYDVKIGAFPAQFSDAVLEKLRQFPADFKVRLPGENHEEIKFTYADPEPVFEAPDVTKPLFDSDGYAHHFVTGNGIQLVTKIGFAYAVWNAKNGECLNVGSEGLRLGNTPLSDEELARRKALGAEMLAGLHADAAVQRTAAVREPVEAHLV